MLIRLVRRYAHRYRKPLYMVVLLQSVQALATLYLPTLNGQIIDNGVLRGDTSYILRSGGIMIAASLVQVAASLGALYFGTRIALGLGRDLREAVFTQVHRFSAEEMGRLGTPSLITRTTNDVLQVQSLAVMTLITVVAAPLTAVGGVLLALNQDVGLSALLLVIVPVLGVTIGAIIVRLRPLFRVMQDRVDGLNRIIREQIGGVRVVRAFVREDDERDRFAAANARVRDVSLGVGYLTALMFPAVMLVFNLSSVTVLWFGGHRVDGGDLRIGALTAFLSYLMQILMSVMTATFMFMMAPRAEVSAERIEEVLGTEPSGRPPADAVTALPEPGVLEFRDVGFSYPGAAQPVLHGIDLVARPGEVTAVIGSTGSGKSTLLALVPRLLDASAGTVLVGGVDVRKIDPALLAREVGYVPQRPFLFSGTVASNLRYGRPDASDDELWHALRVAQAEDFVAALPDGLEARIEQNGGNLSGGQRQRLAIARALVPRPKIYLFDDSFSALDYATDAALRAALADETAEATVVIVAQRVNTVRDADRIVVLDHGEITGTGTHRRLMADSPTYREIVLSQLTEQEAA
ncbi:ABC transporter transmembrane domain-containing protein [Actinomadura rayongensis]|uniref:ATP-binding cassette domain-containing protein n=1 Tax=Actinomadura rayongensis TaxID=1429076 RepID=A0A6I4W8H1_9ACTN|nr:ATP-binding cassette domain-containing protein [Actinomadura rayongensis]